MECQHVYDYFMPIGSEITFIVRSNLHSGSYFLRDILNKFIWPIEGTLAAIRFLAWKAESKMVVYEEN